MSAEDCKTSCALARLIDHMAMLAITAIAYQRFPTKEGAEKLFAAAQRAHEDDLLGDEGLLAVTSHTAHFGVGGTPPEGMQQ